MGLDDARAFNLACPPGALVEVPMRDGTLRQGRLRAPAFLWAGIALIQIEGLPSYYTVGAARPARSAP